MSGFFSDNQTKQKTYDRYYNAMAKSEFVQGKKLKALIQRESLDDASTDSLANLFQQVMAKNREYDYDLITEKLLIGTKGPPEIIKGDSSTKEKKKHTYVPTSTDADNTAYMEQPTAPEDSSEDFYRGVNNVAQKAVNTRSYIKGKKTLKEVVDDQVRNYLNKQKEFRKEDSHRRRQDMADKFANKVMEESEKLLKRKRTETPPNKSPSDKRAAKRAAKQAAKLDEEEPSITRQLFQESDNEDSSDDEKEEKRLRKLNAGIKKVYTDDIGSYKSQFAANLYESIQHRFGEAVEQRKGTDYFNDNAPKPPRKHKMSKISMNQYKTELKGWLDGIFI
ncbi:unnamed protein product [Phytophthora lilii]|uniref:Unnamed protein product n=1 Tax=Phytophthora lilii TaxID=2077276 RepID=A0A9W6XGI7_9STRA|nr:unnamed protein product [Phytophthora lilii]